MNLEQFLEQHYTVLPTSKRGEVRINCPFCGDRKHHGYMNLSKGAFICFRRHCRQAPGSKGYSAYWFLRRAHSLSHDGAIKILGSSIEASLPRPFASEIGEIDPPQGMCDVSPDDASFLGAKAWDYLWRRLGRSRALGYIERYGFGYCYSGEYQGRIILPVRHEGRLIYFQGRSFWGAGPKYVNPITSTKPLFGLEPRSDLILVEGYFDALRVGRGAVSVFGSILTPDQLRTLLRYQPRSVTVAFDPDNAGRKGALAVCRTLKGYLRDVRMALLDAEPSDLRGDAEGEIRAASRRYDLGFALSQATYYA